MIKKAVQLSQILVTLLLTIWMVSIEARLSAQSKFNDSVFGYIESQAGLNEANMKLFKTLSKAVTGN